MNYLRGTKVDDLEESCPKHGCRLRAYSWPYGEPQVRCDLCDREDQELEIKSKLNDLRRHWAACRAGVPLKYAGVTLGKLKDRKSDPRQAAALDKVSKWASLVNMRKYLFLTVIGDKGTGKTEMLSAMLESLSSAGIVGMYATCAGILSEHKAAWKSKTVTELDVADKYIQPPVLVVDEISGPEGEKGEELGARDRHMLETLLDVRYRNGKKTVLAGNIAGYSDFTALVGERVASRAKDFGVLVVCNWEPQRRWAERDEFEHDASMSEIKIL